MYKAANGGSVPVAQLIYGALTDIVLGSIGAICPILNYKLQSTSRLQELKGKIEILLA